CYLTQYLSPRMSLITTVLVSFGGSGGSSVIMIFDAVLIMSFGGSSGSIPVLIMSFGGSSGSIPILVMGLCCSLSFCLGMSLCCSLSFCCGRIAILVGILVSVCAGVLVGIRERWVASVSVRDRWVNADRYSDLNDTCTGGPSA